ncbi:MAG TPA: SDR family oxidoreductase [Bryobacteraceae bacterium]|nr:SDR family oxidoreductase [Bryobacteraceae bacterium]
MTPRRTTRVAEALKPAEARMEPIAIIGMSGRFPGANDVDQLWTNVAHGVESIAILTQEEMRAAGIPEAISKLPGYVNASPVLDGIDQFDAHFFGFSARDAALTDPQHRLFLETAWQALEDAGYDPGRYEGAIGVFGGCELSSYLGHLYQNLESLKYIDGMQLMVTNDKDHLCTQVSYRLNLRGPSVAVQTTCSTSLVAVALACESLQHGRCDMALAGGVTVKVPQRGGYYYTAGSILSPDGHCRPFDAQAQGTIVGSGVGLVVLKRLADAVETGDNIRAVILGVGINNDGSDKVGYTAPSTRGQAGAIRAAHRSAGVDAESIGYVEAHGTGTILGDPIELSALTEVFRESTTRRGFCGIGSAKSNFGHLSCAAGVTGLIKTVLALEKQAIPPTVHYTAPNPAIDLASSPFYVTTRLRRWDRNGTPRRAGISSFGVGGTNAHVILEEAPQRTEQSNRRTQQVFTVSARSEAALNEASKRLATHLRTHPEIDLADAAFTLHLGRRFFKYRRVMTVGSEERERLADALDAADALPSFAAAAERPAVFLFPGQGSQYPGMAAGLYKSEPVVRRAIDRCARLLKPTLNADLKKLLFPATRNRKNAAEALKDTKWAQPALFTVGYALAELWSSWGVKPSAMIGHSVGEYVAATLAGVMSLEDALTVIARRGQLISKMPRGSMLAVMSSPESVERFVTGKISLAAVNASGFVVLSGPDTAMERLEKNLEKEHIPARRLHTSHAFHSSMMNPVLEKFEEALSRIKLSKPVVPFVSTLTGNWAGEDVTQPDYWSRQLRQTVRFADGMRTLMSSGDLGLKNPIWIEAGPGNTLSTFTREIAKGKSSLCLQSLPGPDARRSDTEEMLNSLGQLWANGVEVDWGVFHSTEQRSRISLPAYPFERQTYWVGTNASANSGEVRDPFNWFYRAIWREEPLGASKASTLAGRRILVLDRETSPGAAIVESLRQLGCDVITARPGDAYARLNDCEWVLNPDQEHDFHELADSVCDSERRLSGVIDCWSATSLASGEAAGTDLDMAAAMGLLAPMRLAHALSAQQTVRPLPVLLLAAGTTRVLDTDAMDPPRALSAGVARVLPQEHPGLRVAHIDADAGGAVADMVLAELAAGAPRAAIAIRNGKRFVETFDPVAIRTVKPPTDLPASPVVLITGGLGHMGINLAEALFKRARAKLILLGRTALPAAAEWAAKSEDPQTSPQQKALLQRLAKLRMDRDELIVVPADMNDAAQVKSAVDAGFARFGQIDVVVHGAARIDAAAFGSAAETDWKIVEAQFSPKLRGLLYLMDALRGREPRRWILHSSISSVLGGLGLAAYAGANAMLDALALQRGPHWLSIDWDAWDNAAEAQSASMPSAIKPSEGNEVLLRLIGSWEGSRALVAINLAERLKAWVQHTEAKPAEKTDMDRHPRPNLTTAFVEPRTATERLLAEIWGSQLGLEAVGIHDRFFDLGGHSLLAAQIASEICDRFQIELPVLKLFQAPTIGELAVLVDQARAGSASREPVRVFAATAGAGTELQGNAPEVAAKASYREFYNDVTRRLEQSGMGAVSFFLNYGYVSLGEGDESRFEVPAEVFNRNSVRLAFELIGSTQLNDRKVLDVGCGRGGTVALLAEIFGAASTGVDLSPEAIAFCRNTHGHGTRFEVGDAEHLPFEGESFEVVTNMESSHTYPNLRAFFSEVRRVLAKGGSFLYTDLLPVQRWAEVRMLLESLGLRGESERDITANVLQSCDDVAANRTKAFGGGSEMIDNFLAVPGSAVYEQMHSGAWEYRIVRARRVK